ncbi:hypothetical protein [Thauera sp. Sel9]|uniref:hypothetical protein n=1 Tax=Thauera sp. Sel9 TaxID=2974299 RepID=UPI0021E11939|nr:hypothetical protein [Thauera sp. Sel9]MCV2216151.1 hypothetical protein [Thauera sp. Sel9]
MRSLLNWFFEIVLVLGYAILAVLFALNDKVFMALCSALFSGAFGYLFFQVRFCRRRWS